MEMARRDTTQDDGDGGDGGDGGDDGEMSNLLSPVLQESRRRRWARVKWASQCLGPSPGFGSVGLLFAAPSAGAG